MNWSFEAIGTSWTIDVQAQLSAGDWAAIQVKIRDLIADFDLAYSRFRSDSLVSRIALAAGEYEFPPSAERMISFYADLYTVTNGVVTPLIGQTLVDAGYDAQYSLRPKAEIAKPPAWLEVLSWRPPMLRTSQPVLLDFGAAGKGYLVDLVGELLEASGIVSYCIDAGGDLRQRGSDILRVGLENPSDTSQVIGVLALNNRSLCGSAGNRRAWEGFQHTIDPRTLSSPTEIVATWVLAESTLVADGLATALFFSPPLDLLALAPFEYAYLKSNGECIRSPFFPAEFFVV